MTLSQTSMVSLVGHGHLGPLFTRGSCHRGNHGQPWGLRLGNALSLPCLWASREVGSFDCKDIGGIKWISKEGMRDTE